MVSGAVQEEGSPRRRQVSSPRERLQKAIKCLNCNRDWMGRMGTITERLEQPGDVP
jgi:hypothetical protein